MAKGRKSFLDYFRVSEADDDDYDEDNDDLFDEEDDDEEGFSFIRKRKDKQPAAQKPAPQPAPRPQYSQPTPAAAQRQPAYQPAYQSSAATGNYTAASTSRKKTSRPEDSKLVSFDNQKRSNYKPSSEVYVIKPQEFDDAQTVSDFLKDGKTIVINMEGIQLDPAQRIIDFIGGACYGLGGDLRAISSNIFIAAPHNIEVSGDLRDEILNESTLSPQLGKY
ncbi:MAG: cell division protein SepF [Eubacterium sp.]|nr:cell division protein SepF [Eubacterium sp.]